MTPVAFLFSVLRQTLITSRLELVLFPLNNELWALFSLQHLAGESLLFF
jgi:hypothetical protein